MQNAKSKVAGEEAVCMVSVYLLLSWKLIYGTFSDELMVKKKIPVMLL